MFCRDSRRFQQKLKKRQESRKSVSAVSKYSKKSKYSVSNVSNIANHYYKNELRPRKEIEEKKDKMPETKKARPQHSRSSSRQAVLRLSMADSIKEFDLKFNRDIGSDECNMSDSEEEKEAEKLSKKFDKLTTQANKANINYLRGRK